MTERPQFKDKLEQAGIDPDAISFTDYHLALRSMYRQSNRRYITPEDKIVLSDT